MRMLNNSTSSVAAPVATLTHGRSKISRLGNLCIDLALLWAVCACGATQIDNIPTPVEATPSCSTCIQADTHESEDKVESSAAEKHASEARPKQEDAQIERQKATQKRHLLPDLNKPGLDRDIQASASETDTGTPAITPEQMPEQPEAENDQSSTSVTTSPAANVKHYTVKGGENLYIIARQPFIYADGMLWPLIYRANRDQIKDPRQIYPGQVLNIPRDVSEPDMEQARIKAKETPLFDSEAPSSAE